MLRRLEISNFRCLGEGVVIDFDRLTVLVGRNGAGKSSILDALSFVADTLLVGLPNAIQLRRGIQALRRSTDRRRGGRTRDISIKLDLKLSEGPASYAFRLSSDGDYQVKSEEAVVVRGEDSHRFSVTGKSWSGPDGLAPRVDQRNLVLSAVAGDERFAPLADYLKQIAVYAIYPDTLKKPQDFSSTRPMDRHGGNWASILQEKSAADWHGDLLAGLQRLTGEVSDVRVSMVGGYLSVEFEHGARGWFDAKQESDGTLRMAGIITALHQTPAPTVICLEEPELTIHPGALRLLIEYVREASDRSQIVITSHSPDLLDLVDVDGVRLVVQGKDGSEVRNLSEADRALVRDGLMSIGEMARAGHLQQVEMRLDTGDAS